MRPVIWLYKGIRKKRDTMYSIRRSIDIGFSHHIRGHRGACINLHGHTWKFEVGLMASDLDKEGFVVDFGELKKRVLIPTHSLLDHSLALGETMFLEVEPELTKIGKAFLASRVDVHGEEMPPDLTKTVLPGARNEFPGGMKVTVFDFSPTSERLSKWLYEFAVERLEGQRVRVEYGRIYETLHPVESVGEYRP